MKYRVIQIQDSYYPQFRRMGSWRFFYTDEYYVFKIGYVEKEHAIDFVKSFNKPRKEDYQVVWPEPEPEKLLHRDLD